ncbi:Uncharacterised protein [Mycobacteroides abscessus subsp. abscessus]|nr:Uncharacterised protein [Mycobacteroides abscessus subsp. abscessus]
MIREVAISSCALVIFFVDWTDRMRERSSRMLAMSPHPFFLRTDTPDAGTDSHKVTSGS